MMTEADISIKGSLSYMMETYGLTEKELEGLDLVRLIEDYQMLTLEYTPREVRTIIEEERDIYQDDGRSRIFSILNQNAENDLKIDSDICRIGFYRNEGTLIQKIVFDLQNKVCYAGDAEEKPLTEKQVAALREIPEKWQITEWEHFYGGEEQGSSGSLQWKLVFELADGTICAYGGWTGDGSHLPDTYRKAARELQAVMKSAGNRDGH